MKVRSLISLLLCLLASAGFSQNETNFWYFGMNSALDFTSGVPVTLTNCQINTGEGSASISDASGNLLFYTDGVTVYDASHTIMPNGTGLNGSWDATQSALIVPGPASTTIYYIFTAANNSGLAGLCYSVVDMTLNGGLGDITIKNVQLNAPMAEKITGVNNGASGNTWVISHGDNNDLYYAYLVTPSGVNNIPVISATGNVHASGLGYLKASPSGNKLAAALWSQDQYELTDFDNMSGVVSNPILLTTPPVGSCYGVEFSPDESKLYVDAEFGDDIFQFDITSGTQAGIQSTMTSIATYTGVYPGSLQLAKDGKIYIAKWAVNSLDVINDPNNAGAACNFVSSSVSLGGNQSSIGLPNFIQSFFQQGFTYDNVCAGDSTSFITMISGSLLGVYWDFGDTLSPNNISYDFNPAHYFTGPGTYPVTQIRYYAAGNDTLIRLVTIYDLPQVFLGNDTVLCVGSPLLLNAGGGYSNYLWQDSSTDSTLMVSTDGLYYVTVSNVACSVTDSIQVTFISCSAPSVQFYSSDTSFCSKSCIDFFDLSTNNPTSWQWFFPGADSTQSNLQNPANICYNSYGSFDVTLIACNASGCDTLTITAFINEYQPPAAPVITGHADTLFSTPAYSYQWYDSSGAIAGATGPYYIFQHQGNYFVVITDSNGCIASSLIINTGINDPVWNSGDWTASPVPNDGHFMLTYTGTVIKNARIEVIDLSGRIIYRSEINRRDLEIDLGNCADGLYVLNIATDQKRWYKKIMVIASSH